MPTKSTTNGNGHKPTSTTGEGFDNYTSSSTATQIAPFPLNADATIAQLLNASDDEYDAFHRPSPQQTRYPN